MSTISQNLSERYNAFIAKTRPWDFFMGLANYLEYALSTSSLKKIVDEQVATRDAEYQEVAQLEEQACSEFREAWKRLMEIVERHQLDVSTFTAFTSGIPTPPGRKIETIPEQMEAYEKGAISISGFHSDHLEHFVFDIAANLLKLGYKDELGAYIATVPEAASYFARVNGRPDDGDLMYAGNTYGNFIFSKTLPERFAKIRRIERARSHKSWGAFDDLLKFWQARQEFLKGAGFFETMRDVAGTEYKFGGQDALQVAWAVKDLEAMEENHDVAEDVLHFLRANDFQTKASLVAGTLLGSLPENNTPEAKRMRAARTRAFNKVRDEAWRGNVDERLKKIEEFMEQYQIEKEEREDVEIVEGKWWEQGATPSFETKSGKLFLGGRECQITLTGINQQAVCTKLFELPLGEFLLEVDVINDFQRGDHSRTALKDAVRAINRQILKDFKIMKMIEYQRSRRIRVRKEVFT